MQSAPRSLLARWSSAARPLGVALLLVFSVVAALAVVPAAHASTTISITTTTGSTGCPQIGGTWDGTTNKCTSGSLGANVPVGDTLDVGSGVTLVASNSTGAAIGNVYGTIDNYGTMTGTGSIGLGNGGTVNNYGSITAVGTQEGYTGGGTLNNYGTITVIGVTYGLYNVGLIVDDGTMSVTSSGASGTGVENRGIIDVSASHSLAAGATGTYSTAFDNVNTTNNAGSVVASGYSNGVLNPGTFNNKGALAASMTNTGGYGLSNSGTINDYCASPITVSSFTGNTLVLYPCYTATFATSGIPSTDTWGVTVKWPFGTTHYGGTGSISVPQLGGPITYTYDGTITGAASLYYCSDFCTSTVSITGATTFTAGYATPIVLITTADGSSVCGSGLLYGRTWASATNTCSLGTVDFNIAAQVTLDVDAGVNLDGLSGAGITNYGTIDNYGTVYGSAIYGVSNYGTIYNYGTLTGAGSASGIWNAGTIDNYGTLTGGSTGASPANGAGIYNTGPLDNYGTMDGVNNGAGTGTTTGTGTGTQWGIINAAPLNNVGSMTGTGPDTGIFAYSGTINNEGTMTATGTGSTGYGLQITKTVNNDGTVNAAGPGTDILIWNGFIVGNFNNYCGATVVGYFYGNTPNQISCSTVTFGGSGLPTGTTWGVTATWGPFVLPQDHTGTGTSIAVPLTGSLSYSFDTPVTNSGMTYDCTTGCTGSATVTADTSVSAGYVNPSAAATGTAVLCSSTSMDVGVPATCSATVTGFIGTITGDTVTFSQMGGTGGISFPLGTTCTLTSAGVCATLVAIDGASAGTATVQAAYPGDPNNLASSGITTLSVNPPLSASLSPSSATVSSNGSTSATFTVTVLGGSGVYSYSWVHTGLGAASGCTSTDFTCTVTASSPGAFSVSVTVTDTIGGTDTPSPATVTAGAPSPFQIIPTGATPPTLSLTTYGNTSLSGSFVGMLGSRQAVYNVPSINQTLLAQQLSQGNFASFPNAVNTCLTQVNGQSYVMVSGFFDVTWGGTSTNSTEFIFSGWDSYLTSAQGWPAEPACS